MCLLIVKPSGQKLPEKVALQNAERQNPHGAGVAVWHKKSGHILIKKDFKSAHQMDKWLKRNTRESDAILIHFRYATSGLVDAGNRHPFPVTGNVKELRKVINRTPLAVAHNGVFSQFRGNATESDTMEFIRTVLSGAVCRTMSDPGTQALLKDFLRGQKVAFLDKSGEITLFGDFHVHAGCHYSNHSYETRSFITTYDSDDDETITPFGEARWDKRWVQRAHQYEKHGTAPGSALPLGEPKEPGAGARMDIETVPDGRYNELTNCDGCGKFTNTIERPDLGGGYLCKCCDVVMAGKPGGHTC
jgi:predicted glutamine amidotransferase